MGFKITEYYIRHIIADGIAKLRTNLDAIDDVFAELACPPLNNLYGKKIIDEIKAFFADNDIPVKSALNPNQIDLPSVTVHLISSMEDPELRTMQDHWGYQRTPKKAAILAGPVYAKAYDPETGKLTFDKAVDLRLFIQKRKLFSKRDDVVYTIKGTQLLNDETAQAFERTDQYIHIVDSDGNIPDHVDFAELYLMSTIDFTLERLACVQFRETYEIRVNAATNTDQAVWLYYIVAYILMRNKAAFEEVGLETQTFSASEFTRDAGKAVNVMWGRTIRFNCLVQHTWPEPLDVLEIVGVNVNVETNVTSSISEF